MTPKREPAVGHALPAVSLTADAPRLFCYSALTWNPHRIHYDAPYTTGTEGYRGLVVQGPLLGGLLLRCVEEWATPWGIVTEIDYRSTRAAYADTVVTATGEVSAVEDATVTVELKALVGGEVVCSGQAVVSR